MWRGNSNYYNQDVLLSSLDLRTDTPLTLVTTAIRDLMSKPSLADIEMDLTVRASPLADWTGSHGGNIDLAIDTLISMYQRGQLDEVLQKLDADSPSRNPGQQSSA
jgi:hypothetical protein